MPRLLQINSTANWGSTGKIAEQIGQRAMACGWESYIAYGRYTNPSSSKLIKIGSRVGQMWHFVLSRLFDRHGLASTIATRQLIGEIKRIKPDIIHLHNIHGYYLNYEVLFSFLNSTNIPVVWTLHDCWAFTGHCAHFVDIGCDKWIKGCSECKKHNCYPRSMVDCSSRNYDIKKRLFGSNRGLRIVAVSNWLKSLVEKSFLGEKPIEVIHNGINIDTFKPSNSITDDTIRIVGVSNVWSASKGLYDFYELRKKLSPDKYAITLVGVSQEQKDALPDGINGILRTNSAADLAELYSRADLFVNPTYADTFPTTNIEALACGTPVVTYRTGGSPEAVTNETGFVVEQGDIDGLVRAVKEIEQRGKQHYRKACREHAEEHFDKDKCFDRYIELYNELLTNNR